MENLNNKTIKQYYINAECGTIIITALIHNDTNFVEYYGQLAGMGEVHHIVGVYYQSEDDILNFAEEASADFLETAWEEIESSLVELNSETIAKFKVNSDKIAKNARKDLKYQEW